MDNQIAAVHRLKQATESYAQKGTESITALSSMATAHAVLALIDIITGDREDEIDQLHTEINNLKRLLELKTNDIDLLEEQLEGCRNALRQRENAEANAAKTNNDLRKSYEAMNIDLDLGGA